MEAVQYIPFKPFTAEYPGLWIGEKYQDSQDWEWVGYKGSHQDEATNWLIEDLMATAGSEFLVMVLNEWYRQISQGEAPDVYVDESDVAYRFVYYAG